MMAEAPASIFNKRATEKLRSPEDLDKYVQVTNPSVWVIMLAIVVLLAAVLVWAVFGAVSTSVTTTGVVVKGQALCFLDAEEVAKVKVGDVANVDGERMTVSSVASIPGSREEVSKVLESDYLVSALLNGDWAYAIQFEGDTSELASDVPLTVNITVERVAPISLILRS